jgi:hypothetical protein
MREAIGAWWGGALTPDFEAEGRGRARLADELVALEWDHVLAFYGVTPPPKEET